MTNWPDEVDPTGRDLRMLTDELRAGHRVARNARGEWVLLGHAEVEAAASDPERFSSAVSAHLQVPNGLDGDEHAEARRVLDRYLTSEAIAPFEARFREIARDLVASLPAETDAVRDLGAVFAVRAQSAWLGWPAALEPRLLDWMQDNHAATRSGERARMAQVADDFDDLIREVLEPRRFNPTDDLTSRLMADGWKGRPFTDEELVSILRNWTGGDLGSIALCVGVLAAHLSLDPALQTRLRSGVTDAELDAVIDEILRLDDPFVTNRRKATCPVTVAGVDIGAGEVVKLNWTSANRDESVFGVDVFDPSGHADRNLVYGTGPHVCPGRALATMELRIAVQELLAATSAIFPGEGDPEREVHPVGGYRRVPIALAR